MGLNPNTGEILFYAGPKICHSPRFLVFLSISTTLLSRKAKIGCISTIKTSQLVLYCIRFALSLHLQNELKYGD